MDFLLTLVIIIVVIFGIYRIVHMFTSNVVKANTDYFQQAGVKVDFRQKTITIKNKAYDVGSVTGINTITTSGGRGMGDAIRSTIGIVEIKMDDFKKPIHRVEISGGQGRADDFVQRLTTALRKAGGPDFN
jgi:hypothetical protein